MKCTLFVLCAVALCFSVYAASADPRSGVWTASIRDDDPSTLELSLFQRHNGERRGNNMMGFDVPLADAQGLSAADLRADAANVQFALVHPAGTIKFDGRVAEGNGAGSFRFTPNESFQLSMRTAMRSVSS